MQEATIRAHLSRWLAVEKAVEMRPLVRALNLETSQTVFVGPYLTPALRATFRHDYAAFNAGLMAFPLDLPGTAFYKGARAVSRQARRAPLAHPAAGAAKDCPLGRAGSCLSECCAPELHRPSSPLEVTRSSLTLGPVPAAAAAECVGAMCA